MPNWTRMFFSTTYLPPEGAQALHKYKYAGADRSWIYQNILTPMNIRLIEYFPKWLAPNTITVSGLLCVILSHFVMLYYCPRLEGEAPWWAYVLNAACLLIYQTLDNLDGRQARRTGSSSPLGLFFDHGCDAVNCTFSALTMASTIQTGTSLISYAILLNAVFIFYLNTWEEYYTGELVLPAINGPTEGLLVCAGLHLWTALRGGSWWVNEVVLPMPFPKYVLLADSFATTYWPHYRSIESELASTGSVSVRYNTILVLIMTLASISTMLNHLWTVYGAVRRTGSQGPGRHSHDTLLQQRFPFIHALTRLAPFTIVVILATLWI